MKLVVLALARAPVITEMIRATEGKVTAAKLDVSLVGMPVETIATVLVWREGRHLEWYVLTLNQIPAEMRGHFADVLLPHQARPIPWLDENTLVCVRCGGTRFVPKTAKHRVRYCAACARTDQLILKRADGAHRYERTAPVTARSYRQLSAFEKHVALSLSGVHSSAEIGRRLERDRATITRFLRKQGVRQCKS